jgi:hypothetical protein
MFIGKLKEDGSLEEEYYRPKDVEGFTNYLDLPEGYVLVKYQEDVPVGYNVTSESKTPILVDGNWVITRTYELKEADPKSQKASLERRAKLLTESDWVVTKALELGEEIPAEWKEYRQALRDITLQELYPMYIYWPTKPE